VSPATNGTLRAAGSNDISAAFSCILMDMILSSPQPQAADPQITPLHKTSDSPSAASASEGCVPWRMTDGARPKEGVPRRQCMGKTRVARNGVVVCRKCGAATFKTKPRLRHKLRRVDYLAFRKVRLRCLDCGKVQRHAQW
jgi:hypothetical protein